MAEEFVFLQGQADGAAVDPHLVARRVDDEIVDLDGGCVVGAVLVPKREPEAGVDFSEGEGSYDEVRDTRRKVEFERHALVGEDQDGSRLLSEFGPNFWTIWDNPPNRFRHR